MFAKHFNLKNETCPLFWGGAFSFPSSVPVSLMHHPPPLDVEQPKKKPRMGKDSEGAVRFGLQKVFHSRPSLARTYCKQDKEIQHYTCNDILLSFFLVYCPLSMILIFFMFFLLDLLYGCLCISRALSECAMAFDQPQHQGVMKSLLTRFIQKGFTLCQLSISISCWEMPTLTLWTRMTLLVELLQNLLTTKESGGDWGPRPLTFSGLSSTWRFFSKFSTRLSCRGAAGAIVWSWPKRVDEIVGRGGGIKMGARLLGKDQTKKPWKNAMELTQNNHGLFHCLDEC